MMSGIARLVDVMFLAFALLVVLRVLLSWLPEPMPRSTVRAITDAVKRATDWFLAPFRRFVPVVGGLDLSPAVALVTLGIVHSFALRLVLGG